MSKEDFIRQKRLADGEVRTADIAVTTFFFAGLLGTFALATWQERSHGHLPGWMGLCLLFLTFAVAIAAAPNAWWNAKRRARRHGLICPSCHGALNGPAGQIAIASGNCPLCGEKLFADEEADAPRDASVSELWESSTQSAPVSAPPALEFPRTKEEFLLRERAMGRGNKPLLIGLALMSVLAIAVGVILPHMKTHPEEARRLGIVFLVAFVGLYAITFLVASRRKNQTREYGMACPSCQKPLVGLARNLVTATGFCGNCGEHLFDDVLLETETNAAQRKEFAERKRAVDREAKSAKFILGGILALSLAVILVACLFVPAQGDFHGLPLSTLQNGMIFSPIVLMYGGVILMVLQKKRLRQKYVLTCASCRKPLQDWDQNGRPTGKLAVATGKCFYCGGNAIGNEE